MPYVNIKITKEGVTKEKKKAGTYADPTCPLNQIILITPPSVATPALGRGD